MFESLGGFHEQWRFVGDADFWLRGLLRGHRFARVAYPSLAAFRMHAGQLSQRTGLAWCQRAAWLGVLAGPLGMALTAYAWVFLSKPEMAALFDRGDHLSV